MPRPKKLSIPTKVPLSHTQRLPPASLEVNRTLSKLARPSLISLALEWLSPKHIALCGPYLLEDEEDDDLDQEAPYTPAQSVEELQEIYQELERRKGGKKEVIERITEGDWRHGLTLYQLATADSKNLLDHSISTPRWTAFKITSISTSEADTNNLHHKLEHPLPRVHAQTFLANLQAELAPLSKAHYYLTRLTTHSATILRIALFDSPYSTSHADSLTESKTTFLLYPDNTPYIYISHPPSTALSSSLDARSTQAILLAATASALSAPRNRYTLSPTSLSAKSLSAIFTLRGPARSTHAQGGWGVFVADSFGVPALDFTARAPPDITAPPAASLSTTDDKENHPTNNTLKRTRDSSDATRPSSPGKKRRVLLAATRFGLAGTSTDDAALERLDVRIADSFPAGAAAVPRQAAQNSSTQNKKRGRKARTSLLDGTPAESQAAEAEAGAGEGALWRPDVRVSFVGAHVVAGIRALVEGGVVDGEKMPGWMTGEAGVSVGVVRGGRIVTKGL